MLILSDVDPTNPASSYHWWSAHNSASLMSVQYITPQQITEDGADEVTFGLMGRAPG